VFHRIRVELVIQSILRGTRPLITNDTQRDSLSQCLSEQRQLDIISKSRIL